MKVSMWRRWLLKLGLIDGPDMQIERRSRETADDDADRSILPLEKILVASSTQLNGDVLIEILLRLPVQSLLRSKVVCKSWHEIIVSRSFQKLHIMRHANNTDDAIIIGFTVAQNRISKVSMFLLDGQEIIIFGKILNYFMNPNFLEIVTDPPLMIVGQANGLICLHSKLVGRPYIIYNPSLGKVRLLPLSPACNICHNHTMYVDGGFCLDIVSQDYKVVQLLFCGEKTHASIYSSMTNSWRVVADDKAFDHKLIIAKPIKSLSEKGSFAHWIGGMQAEEKHQVVILSFDMKNEVFRILEMPKYRCLLGLGEVTIFAKDDQFVLFIVSDNKLKMFDGRFEGNKLYWDFVKDVGPFHQVIPKPKALWVTNCVVLQNSINQELFIYNYVDQQYVRCLKMPDWGDRFDIFYYKGSFISP